MRFLIGEYVVSDDDGLGRVVDYNHYANTVLVALPAMAEAARWPYDTRWFLEYELRKATVVEILEAKLRGLL